MKTPKEKRVSPKGENLSYEGTVTVSVQKKGGGFRVKKYKNNGGYPLFHFLALSTCGLYKKAETFRPKYIELFYIAPEQGEEEPSAERIREYLTRRIAESKSSRVFYKTTPTPMQGGTPEDPQYSTLIEFMIPTTQIKKSPNGANIVALFYRNDEDSSEYCAFTKLDSETINIIKQQESNSQEYNIFIQWKLTFANKI